MTISILSVTTPVFGLNYLPETTSCNPKKKTSSKIVQAFTTLVGLHTDSEDIIRESGLFFGGLEMVSCYRPCFAQQLSCYI